MARSLPVDLRVEFVPLPPEQRAAWEYAMQIISKYLDLATAKMEDLNTENHQEVFREEMR